LPRYAASHADEPASNGAGFPHALCPTRQNQESCLECIVCGSGISETAAGAINSRTVTTNEFGESSLISRRNELRQKIGVCYLGCCRGEDFQKLVGHP
jgi:hypothetical protein